MSHLFPLSESGAAAECRTLLDTAGQARLEDLTACGRFGLKGPGADRWFAQQYPLPEINRWVDTNGGRLLRLGARDLMVLADDPAARDAVSAMRAQWGVRPEGHSSWREETWAWLRLTGPAAIDVAARLTAVDLRPQAFGPDHILQTRFAHLDAILLRTVHDAEAGLDILFDIAATAQVVRDIAAAVERHEVFG